MADKRMQLVIGARDDASRVLSRVQRSLDGLRSSARSIRGAFSTITAPIRSAFGGALALISRLKFAILGVGIAITAFGASAVATATRMDSLRRGMVAVMGSAALAAAEIERLREVAKLPGLGLEEAIQGSIRLQAAGLSAREARQALQAFGNALATVGAGKAELQGVILALSQIAAKGRVSAEEINQLNERLPQIRQAMRRAFGTADTEALGKMGIDAMTFIRIITREFSKLPAVVSGPQNAFENLSDTFKKLQEQVGNVLLPGVMRAAEGLSNAFERLSQFVAHNRELFTQFANALGEVGQTIGHLALATLLNFMRWIVANRDGILGFFERVRQGLIVVYNVIRNLPAILSALWTVLRDWAQRNQTRFARIFFALGLVLGDGLFKGIAAAIVAHKGVGGTLGGMAEMMHMMGEQNKRMPGIQKAGPGQMAAVGPIIPRVIAWILARRAAASAVAGGVAGGVASNIATKAGTQAGTFAVQIGAASIALDEITEAFKDLRLSMAQFQIVASMIMGTLDRPRGSGLGEWNWKPPRPVLSSPMQYVPGIPEYQRARGTTQFSLFDPRYGGRALGDPGMVMGGKPSLGPFSAAFQSSGGGPWPPAVMATYRGYANPRQVDQVVREVLRRMETE
jgi:tape measure domain-containing protein